MTSSSFLQLIVDLKQSEAQIPKKWSTVPRFTLLTTLFLTKTENRTKKSTFSKLMVTKFLGMTDINLWKICLEK